jgi:hypothetical protein
MIRSLAGLLLFVSVASGDTGFEKPAVLNAKDLVPAGRLRGAGFRVDDKVPTDGVMGIYTIRTDAATFHEDAGAYQVRGRELLEIRLAEMPAIVKLNETGKTAAFTKAMGTAAVRPLEAAGNMAMNPGETVAGLPGGVGRLFDRVESGGARLFGSGDGGSAAGGAATATRDALGYEQERRKLAKSLGVDPYTSNAILARKLDEIAWAAFAGRFSVSTAVSVAVPGSMVITGVRTVDDLVWDTPRGDLIVDVEKKLGEIGVPAGQVSAFTHSSVMPLSLQVAAVENLRRLGDVPGRRDVVVAIAGAATEPQVRFFATALRMLADYHEKQKPIAAIAVPGPLVGRDRDGGIVVPAPVDYVSWTERIASFAKNPELVAAPKRTLWLTGKMSARARKELQAAGWTIRDTATVS